MSSKPGTVPAQPGIHWRKTESPLLPLSWPPSPLTAWVRYTFAYGTNPTLLCDGSYVTRPLSRAEWKVGAAVVTQEINSELKPVGIQGVVPLDTPARQALQIEKQVSAACLKLAWLPDPNLPETQAIRAFYRAWFQYNGAFLSLVRENHAGFIDWVNAAP